VWFIPAPGFHALHSQQATVSPVKEGAYNNTRESNESIIRSRERP